MEGCTKRVRINIQTGQSFQNQRVNQLLSEYEKTNSTNQNIGFNRNSKMAKSAYLLQNSWRKWLFQKGKGYLVDFDQQQRKKLKDFFNTLDRKKCGSIGLNQLQQMLLGLGLADGLEEVQKLIGNVDGDHSGKIEFEEFIEMIQDQTQENQVTVNFFKQLIFSQMKKSKQKQSLLSKLNFSKTTNPTDSQKEILKNNLPFQMIVNQIKRNHILSSMSVGRCKPKGNVKDQNRISKGKFVVKALQKMEERRIMRKLRQNPLTCEKQPLRN